MTIKENPMSNPYFGTWRIIEMEQWVKRTPSSRQKRAIIKIDCYRFKLKYIAAGVRYPNA